MPPPVTSHRGAPPRSVMYFRPDPLVQRPQGVADRERADLASHLHAGLGGEAEVEADHHARLGVLARGLREAGPAPPGWPGRRRAGPGAPPWRPRPRRPPSG